MKQGVMWRPSRTEGSQVVRDRQGAGYGQHDWSQLYRSEEEREPKRLRPPVLGGSGGQCGQGRSWSDHECMVARAAPDQRRPFG
jgi:hypothetical protein